MIRLYNSMTRQVEDFTPSDPNMIKMYVCGPTVYDTPHLGNARPAIVFDVLYRLLRFEYGSAHVHYARNYTDIDDKIIERARAEGIEIGVLTERTINSYEETMDALNVLTPWTRPLATEHIGGMVAMIAQLVEHGHAYVAEGHVLFDIASWPVHGALSGHRQEDLESGQHRVAVADYKKAPGDFVLWKPSVDGQPGWDSPWGYGRPGWHIECSAMIDKVFGSKTIDIHGGGADLRFPHHDCEISQFEACNEIPLAHFWVHNAMLLVDGQKMAKSAGNFTTVQDVRDRDINGHAIRLALLTTHYRSPLDWTDDLINYASKTLTDWHRALELVDVGPAYNGHAEFILAPLRNDLNVPLAISHIHALMGQIANDAVSIAAGVRFAADILGVPLTDHDSYLRGFGNRDEIESLIAKRIEARRQRDWKESDRIRGVLTDMGVAVEDGPTGTSWRRA